MLNGNQMRAPRAENRQAFNREVPGRAVDLVHLSHHTLGNRELEREILRLFVKQAEIYLDRLRAANSPKIWCEAAHTIKGSARGIGAWDVVRLAEKAEKLKFTREGKPKKYILERLAEALNDANRFIEDVLTES